MPYFQYDPAGQVVVFKDTDQLATRINEIIAYLRTAAGRVHPQLAQWVRDRTPGPRMVSLGVKLVLKNNGFDLRQQEFSYQGRLGLVTRPINWRLNREIQGAIQSAQGMAQVALTSLLEREMTNAHVPQLVASRIAGPLVSLVLERAMEGEVGAAAEGLDVSTVMSAAADARATASSVVAQVDTAALAGLKAAGAELVQAGRQGAAATAALFVLDRERSLIRIENTADFAAGVNGVIEALRNVASAVPVVGGDLGPLVRQKTPGPTKVRLGVRAALHNQAFNYTTMEFESQGSALGTNRIANHFINQRLHAQARALLDVHEVAIRATELWMRSGPMSDIPEPLRSQAAHRIAIRVIGLAMEQNEAEA